MDRNRPSTPRARHSGLRGAITMLGSVLAQMEAQGLLRGGARTHCNASFRLDNVLVDVFDGAGAYYHVRMTDEYDLEREYLIAREVWSRLGPQVPRPVYFGRVGPISFVVFEGVTFSCLTARQLLFGRPNERPVLDLLMYLERAAGMAAAHDGNVQDDLLSRMRNRYLSTEQEALIDKVLSMTDLGHVSALRSVPQHGDFVLNNLGLRPAGLFVFDWEDFGRITVPGFDLAVLLASTMKFNGPRLNELCKTWQRGQPAASPGWLPEACRFVGVDLQCFVASIPFYLSLFMWLKDRYSPTIRTRVRQAIEGLVSRD